MATETGRTSPLWTRTAALPEEPALARDERADVCVVGAGIAGLTTAHLLAAAGRSVLVLDAAGVASGETGRTTAHLSNAVDDRYLEIERELGAEAARIAAESHSAAIDLVEAIASREKIDCGFERVDGFLYAAPPDSCDLLREEAEAARRAGLAVELVERPPVALEPGPALRFPRQGQMHPVRYVRGLAEALRRGGGRILRARVVEVESGETCRLRTAEGPTVEARAVVMATNVPSNDRVAIHTKQAAYRTYALAAEIAGDAVPAGLYWDTLDPYHYVRTHAEGGKRFLVVGGEDHKTGQADDPHERHGRLERWARDRFPRLGAVAAAWSGQVLETVDGLAFIGRNPLDEPNVFVATGDSGMGMTHGTIAGMILSELVLGREHPWAALYDPSRKSPRSAGTFLEENANVVAQYADWVTGGDVRSADEIPPGEGAVLRRGASKIAVWRAPDGSVHERSAVCPHLGCIVAWNRFEKSWDCPCHGSRFSAEGEVRNGPARKGLAEA